MAAQAVALDRYVGEARRLLVRDRWRRGAAVVGGWFAFVALWAAVSAYVVGPVRLPGPAVVGQRMWEIMQSGAFFPQFRASIFKVAVGFVLAAIVGASVGFLMGRSRYWRAFFHDPVMVAGSIPGLTYAVLALVVFGISKYGPIVAVGLVSMPYIAINVAEGLRGIDQRLIQMSKSYQRTKLQILRHVLIPSTMPFVFGGIRLSFALAWKVEALTEVFGSSSGIGFQIRKEFEDFSIAGVMAWVFLFIAFMLLVERVVLVQVERNLFRWRGDDTRGRK